MNKINFAIILISKPDLFVYEVFFCALCVANFEKGNVGNSQKKLRKMLCYRQKNACIVHHC